MAKQRKTRNQSTVEVAVAVMRQGNRREYVAGLRDGRKVRATTFADRKKQADRRACRGRVEVER